jgi:hypothetical protein
MIALSFYIVCFRLSSSKAGAPGALPCRPGLSRLPVPALSITVALTGTKQ